jgi:hypothetical protein
MAVQPGINGEKVCGWLIGTLMVFAAGSWNYKSSSVSTTLIFAS